MIALRETPSSLAIKDADFPAAQAEDKNSTALSSHTEFFILNPHYPRRHDRRFCPPAIFLVEREVIYGGRKRKGQIDAIDNRPQFSIEAERPASSRWRLRVTARLDGDRTGAAEKPLSLGG